MKSMKVFGVCFLSAINLVGCGGGKDAAAPVVPPTNPYVNGQMNSSQPYTCQAGMIQLRNAFGQSQCFQTADLATACAQIGGLLTQGSLCRKERQIPGSAKGKFRNNGAMAPDNIPIRVNLFPSEAVKVYGTVDSLDGDAVQWNAQLIQNGMALGSSGGDTIRARGMANLSITSISTANSAQYYTPYSQYQCVQYPCNVGQQPYVNQYPSYSPYLPTQYPNGNGIYAAGFYGQPSQAIPNLFILQIMFEGRIKVDLHATAISCEDGRGNSYPCQ